MGCMEVKPKADNQRGLIGALANLFSRGICIRFDAMKSEHI